MRNFEVGQRVRVTSGEVDDGEFYGSVGTVTRIDTYVEVLLDAPVMGWGTYLALHNEIEPEVITDE